jgi:DNA-binding IclR family transcriptional regulator
MNESVRSAARALDLLEYLAAVPDAVALTSLAAVFGLPKSSALALLRTLVLRGYIVRDDNLYRLNDAFRHTGFGWGGDALARLVAVARPGMDTLCEELGETVILGTLGDDGRVRFVAKSVAESNVRYDVDLNETNPPYCMAIGRVLLAHLPRAQRDDILAAFPRERRTPKTVVDLDRLNTIIDEVGAQGFCIVEEEFAVGGIGVAMPIFGLDSGFNRRVIAALDVGYVSSRFPARRDLVLAAMKARIDSLPAQFTLADAPSRRVSPVPP